MTYGAVGVGRIVSGSADRGSVVERAANAPIEFRAHQGRVELAPWLPRARHERDGAGRHAPCRAVVPAVHG